jgi:hypothetical protein
MTGILHDRHEHHRTSANRAHQLSSIYLHSISSVGGGGLPGQGGFLKKKPWIHHRTHARLSMQYTMKNDVFWLKGMKEVMRK